MYRLYLLIFTGLLLAACGGAAVAPPQAASAGEFIQQMSLSAAAAPVVSLHDTIPQPQQPKLKVNLPPATGQRRSAAPDGWTMLLDEDFQRPDPEVWPPTTHPQGGNAATGDGKLRITANPGWIMSMLPGPAWIIKDGYIGATFTLDGSGSAGVLVRSGKDSDGPTMYACGAYNNGDFFCYKQLHAHWTELASGNNAAIRPGAPITIGLQAVGDALTLSVNGAAVASFDDNSLRRGAWGVFAQGQDAPTIALFSHVEIARPPTTAATPTPTRRATPTASGDDQVLLDDDFTGDKHGGWLITSNDAGSAQIRDGALVMYSAQPQTVIVDYPREAADLADATIDTTMRIDGAKGRAGVFARFQRADSGEWSMYYCWIDNTRHWGCGIEVENQSRALNGGILDWIKPNDFNRLTLTIAGANLSFSVDGVQALRMRNESLARGAWGVLAGTDDGPVTAYFDRVTISSATAAGDPVASVTPPPNGPVRGKVGQRVVSAGVALTVLALAHAPGTYTDLLDLPAEQQYIDLELLLENDGSYSFYYDSAFFKLRDEAGYEYRKYPIDYTLPAFGFGTMVPGERARGHINFIVPSGDPGLNLVLDMSHVGGYRNIYIDLGQ